MNKKTNDYEQLSKAADHVKRKLFKHQLISKTELDILRKFVKGNPTVPNLSAFAMGKKHVI